MEFEQARTRFLELLAEMEKEMCVPVSIDDDATQHHDFGWVFFFEIDSPIKEYFAGGGPTIIDRHTGEVFEIGSANSPEWYINNYKKFRDPFKS